MRIDSVPKEESQGATEFLITYGWSILIIAGVMIVLYALQVFTVADLRARPGLCRVVRPYGPYTGSDVALFGVCGSMLPDSVAGFSPAGTCTGNGAGSCSFPEYIYIRPIRPGILQNSFTITAWIYWYGPSATHCQGIFDSLPSPSSGFGLFGYGGNNGACGVLWINGSYVKWPGAFYNFTPGSWQFIAAEYDKNTGVATVFNNTRVFSTSNQGSRGIDTGNASTIGAVYWTSGKIYPFNGMIADVQLYNTSLSPQAVDGLYNESIGGAPIQTNNLVGWWQLNMNPYDYSGNFNNGTAYNVTYTSDYPAGVP